MSFTHLSLINFRNYLRLELDLPPGVIVLHGANGQGKTNLLEALYFVATTKSPRASSDRELLHWHTLAQEPPFARAAAVARRLQVQPSGPPVAAGQPIRLEIVLLARDPAERDAGPGAPGVIKRTRVNGLPCRAIDLIGQVKVVVFSPLDIDLIAGAPAPRRRYLDITNAQIDRRYVRSLQQYNRIVLQRNHLLRHIRERRAGVDQLAYWDQLLAEAGSYIIWQRRRMVDALNDLLFDLFPRVTGARARLRLDYLGTTEAEPAASAEDAQRAISATFRERLAAVRDRELAQGASLVGPHRDDFAAAVDGIDMRLFGSRGQQRSVALAIKLAEAEYIQAQSGDVPVLLLDDVMSELDVARRQHVIEAVQGERQAILTTTDLDLFRPDFLAAATIFRVHQGIVERS